MTSPAGIPNFLVEGSSIAQSAVGVKGLGQTPCLSRTGLRTLRKITTTNPQWGGRADLRIGGRSSDLLIGNQIPTVQSQQINSFHAPATTVLPL